MDSVQMCDYLTCISTFINFLPNRFMAKEVMRRERHPLLLHHPVQWGRNSLKPSTTDIDPTARFPSPTRLPLHIQVLYGLPSIGSRMISKSLKLHLVILCPCRLILCNVYVVVYLFMIILCNFVLIVCVYTSASAESLSSYQLERKSSTGEDECGRQNLQPPQADQQTKNKLSRHITKPLKKIMGKTID